MSSRRIKLAKTGQVTPCPKCGNELVFVAHSQQVAEDACNVWVNCDCGYDPTEMDHGSRYEDVWGGLGNENISIALHCWNDAVLEG